MACVRVGNNFNVYWFVWGRWGSRNECVVVAAQKHKCAKFRIVTHSQNVGSLGRDTVDAQDEQRPELYPQHCKEKWKLKC